MSLRRKRFFSQYIGDRLFYRSLFAVVLPIMLQNGLSTFVNLLDNIMVGSIGTEQMSGVSIVNQLLFVFNVCLFGGVSGAGIFTAQFFGKRIMKVSGIHSGSSCFFPRGCSSWAYRFSCCLAIV